MKSKKLLSIIAPVCLIATLGMSACKTGGLGSADTYDLDVTIDTKGTTISFWTGFGSAVNEVLEPMIEEFETKTGITVEYETKGGYSNLQTAINLSATKQEYANVAVGYPDHFAGYITSNIQLRLDGLIENDHKREKADGLDKDGLKVLDYSDFYSDYLTENETLEFKEDGSGYVLGLPFNKSSEVMCYNSNFFEWAKTATTDIFVPKTWAEVKSVGLAVKQLFKNKGVYGKFLGADGNVYDTTDAATAANTTVVYDASAVTEENFHFFSYDSTENLFISLVRQYGGTYTEVDTTKTGKGYAVFNDEGNKEKTLEAMAMLRDLWNNGLIGIAATFGEESYCSNPFKNGQSLLNVGSTGGLSNVVGTTFTTKAAQVPQKDLTKAYVISQGTNLALFNKGTEKQKVAAWKLIVYLTQQTNGEFAAGTGYFPTCNYAYNSEAYQDYLANALSGKELLQQESAKINSEVYSTDSWSKFVDPGFRGSSSVRTEIGYIAGYIFSGEYNNDDQAILDAVYKKITDYVKTNA